MGFKDNDRDLAMAEIRGQIDHAKDMIESAWPEDSEVRSALKALTSAVDRMFEHLANHTHTFDDPNRDPCHIWSTKLETDPPG